MTPQERSESARRAAQTRWAMVRTARISQAEVALIDPRLDKPPIALFSGELRMAARSFACHVLDDGMRVILRDDIVRSLTDHFERDPGLRLKVAARRVDFLIRPLSADEHGQRNRRHDINGDLPLKWWTLNRRARAGIRQNLVSATGYSAVPGGAPS
jgi:hypothetical protein